MLLIVPYQTLVGVKSGPRKRPGPRKLRREIAGTWICTTTVRTFAHWIKNIENASKDWKAMMQEQLTNFIWISCICKDLALTNNSQSLEQSNERIVQLPKIDKSRLEQLKLMLNQDETVVGG